MGGDNFHLNFFGDAVHEGGEVVVYSVVYFFLGLLDLVGVEEFVDVDLFFPFVEEVAPGGLPVLDFLLFAEEVDLLVFVLVEEGMEVLVGFNVDSFELVGGLVVDEDGVGGQVKGKESQFLLLMVKFSH